MELYFSNSPLLANSLLSAISWPIFPISERSSLVNMRRTKSDGPTCHICGLTTLRGVGVYHPLFLNMDHLIPLADGGKGKTAGNLRPAHRVCNLKRGRREITESLRRECAARVIEELGR